MKFSREDIVKLANEYPFITSDTTVEEEIKEWLQNNRFLNKDMFLRLCCWKSQRPKRHYIKNNELEITEVTRISFSTSNEKERIEALLNLQGVGYPVASAILHFAFPEKYTILDFRVLESLDWEQPSYYSFKFWEKYCHKIRELSIYYDVSIRMIDKALWTYSKLNKNNCKKNINKIRIILDYDNI